MKRVNQPGHKCPACGHLLARPARFCYFCGAFLVRGPGPQAVLDGPPSQAGPTRPCPRCEYPCPPQGWFCANCGLRVDDSPRNDEERRAREQRAKLARLTPDQRDQRIVRNNAVIVAVGLFLFAAAIWAGIAFPARDSAFIWAPMIMMLSGLSVATTRIKRARQRMRTRSATVGVDQ